MLQQGAMALASFHGKLSQPLKHAHVPPVHSPGYPPPPPLLGLLSHRLGLELTAALLGRPTFHMHPIPVDGFISN